MNNHWEEQDHQWEEQGRGLTVAPNFIESPFKITDTDMRLKLPPNNLYAWIDFETTGTDPIKDHPIELGMIITDSELRALASVDTLIKLPEDAEWSDEAEEFHRIEEHVARSVSCGLEDAVHLVDAAVSKAIHCMAMRGSYAFPQDKVILVSDNIQFEWQILRKMFRDAKVRWPFHYCGWDTSMLLECTGVGDPKDPPHRALADVGGLIEAMREALSR